MRRRDLQVYAGYFHKPRLFFLTKDPTMLVRLVEKNRRTLILARERPKRSRLVFFLHIGEFRIAFALGRIASPGIPFDLVG